MERSNKKLVTDELLDFLKLNMAEHLVHRVTLLKTRDYIITMVKALQDREREHIMDAFHMGAEYGTRAPYQIELLAKLYYSLRFPRD